MPDITTHFLIIETLRCAPEKQEADSADLEGGQTEIYKTGPSGGQGLPILYHKNDEPGIHKNDNTGQTSTLNLHSARSTLPFK